MSFHPTAVRLALCAALLSPASATLAQNLLVRHAEVVSPEREEPLHDMDVLIRDGVIAKVARGIPAPEGTPVLEAKGLFLTPGLIDSHVHLYHATGLKPDLTNDFAALRSAYLAQQPRSYLFFGFTSVLELNAEPGASERFEAAVDHPRLFHCGHGLALDDGFLALEMEEAGSFVRRFPHYLHDPASDRPTPDGDSPANHSPERSVAALVADGARCIKLYYEEALWYPGGPPPFRLPSQGLIEAVVRAAHERGVPVLLHATTPAGHRMALRAGVDIAAHGPWEWPDVGYEVAEPPAAIAALVDEEAKSGLRMQPTMRTIRNTQSMFDPAFLSNPQLAQVLPRAYLEYLRGPAQAQRDAFLKRFGEQIVPGASPAAVGERLETFNARYERLIRRFSDHGGRLLLGTDTAVGGFGWGSPPGLAGYLEMQSWARAGIAPRKIFAAATTDNANAFGLGDQLGTIETGKRADLLLLTRNPLADISAFDSLQTVILGGKPIDRQSLAAN